MKYTKPTLSIFRNLDRADIIDIIKVVNASYPELKQDENSKSISLIFVVPMDDVNLIINSVLCSRIMKFEYTRDITRANKWLPKLYAFMPQEAYSMLVLLLNDKRKLNSTSTSSDTSTSLLADL